MKTTSWICWLLAICIYLAEAKNKIRRPLSPSYPSTLLLKQPWSIGHRISMGNTIHIGGNLSHQRVPYKHINYRIRRPPMSAYVSPTSWKNQIPVRATLNNRPILPQRMPVKEFHSVSKVPEYSPEYRPELVLLPATHRGGIDDDKGPIHTIPAPNLSPADKPFASTINSEKIIDRRPVELNYHTTVQSPNIGLATINSSLPPQRTATSSSPQHQYEVTESNDLTVLKERQIAQPATLQSQELDITRLYSTIINPHAQSNEIFINHPVNANTGVVGPNVQFGQLNVPTQTNLQSSLHVGFPSTAIQTPYTITQQIPDLHVGHPAPAGSPLSATQLYDLLNNFPHKLGEQSTSDQQHILHQQLGQIFQPDAVTSFSQPQMHSFNYDEQANQLQQQQQISRNQAFIPESVTAEYNLDLTSSIDVIRKQNEGLHTNKELAYPIDGTEQSENNIEYEERNHEKSPTTYFKKLNDDSVISTKFYTTLPNREAAEKLAALAAAGNVNSRLIGQLRKRQESMQNDDTIPSNHKNDDTNQQRTDGNQVEKYNQQKSHHNNQYHHKQNYKVQNNDNLPLQIMVTDEADYVSDDQQSNTKDNVDMEYEYENEDGEIENLQSPNLFDGRITSHDDDSHTEFGTRLRSKTKE